MLGISCVVGKVIFHLYILVNQGAIITAYLCCLFQNPYLFVNEHQKTRRTHFYYIVEGRLYNHFYLQCIIYVHSTVSIKSRHRITPTDNCFDQEAVTKEYKAMSKLVVHYNGIQLIRDNQILYISDLAFLSVLVTCVVIGSRQDALLYRIIVI